MRSVRGMIVFAVIFLMTISVLHLHISSSQLQELIPSADNELESNANVHEQHGELPLEEKRQFVKQMMKDAWEDYCQYAWGDNELKPLSKAGQDGPMPKVGLTIIDSLDTLHMMGLMKEFYKAREWVKTSFNFTSVNQPVSLFEANIRILGGLLTAFALTEDSLFKDQAEAVGRALLPAFNTTTGLPYGSINPAQGKAAGELLLLAELGSLHLEMVYLSEITGDKVFEQKVTQVRDFLKRLPKFSGLYADRINVDDGQFFGTHVTVGVGADSFYEYLLKSWIQTGDLSAREMYDEAVTALLENNLLQVSNQSHLLFFGEKNAEEKLVSRVGSQLQCFGGGMFILGAVTSPDGKQRERDYKIGINLTRTCRETYVRTKTGLGPENFQFTDALEAVAGNFEDRAYLLRPETVESYFYLYRITKDPKYQDWGWDVVNAIQKYAKVGPGRGYSGLKDVDEIENPEFDDIQQSFFLAETLKYLYLLFSPPDFVDLSNWVFNTEAHPLPILKHRLQ